MWIIKKYVDIFPKWLLCYYSKGDRIRAKIMKINDICTRRFDLYSWLTRRKNETTSIKYKACFENGESRTCVHAFDLCLDQFSAHGITKGLYQPWWFSPFGISCWYQFFVVTKRSPFIAKRETLRCCTVTKTIDQSEHWKRCAIFSPSVSSNKNAHTDKQQKFDCLTLQ